MRGPKRARFALLTGKADAASQAFREELMLCREMVIRPVAFEGLRGRAAVAVVCNDAKRAAILVGAAAAHRYGKSEDPVETRLDETFFEPPAHGAERTSGTLPHAKAAGLASKTRSRTPSRIRRG